MKGTEMIAIKLEGNVVKDTKEFTNVKIIRVAANISSNIGRKTYYYDVKFFPDMYEALDTAKINVGDRISVHGKLSLYVKEKDGKRYEEMTILCNGFEKLKRDKKSQTDDTDDTEEYDMQEKSEKKYLF